MMFLRIFALYSSEGLHKMELERNRIKLEEKQESGLKRLWNRTMNCCMNNYNPNKPLINILPDDSLRRIFSFLKHKERIKYERVCKRWRDILRDSWKLIEEL